MKEATTTIMWREMERPEPNREGQQQHKRNERN